MDRKQELEVVTTSYFLEERLSELKKDREELRNQKPRKPVEPSEPHLEKEEVSPIPYPDEEPDNIEMSGNWKKILILSFVAPVILGIIAWILVHIPFIGGMLSVLISALGTVAFWGGIVMTVKEYRRARKEKKSLEEASVIRKKNSDEYKQKCAEIDEENKKRQAKKDQELHDKYVKRYAQYEENMKQYKADVENYEQVLIPEWNEEDNALITVMNDTHDALQEVYSRNIIPIQYRKLEALVYLATFLNTSEYDLKFAIENYNQYVSQCKQDTQISLQQIQIRIMRETLSNQQYANWLHEQVLDMSEQANDTLKSISNWQKADVAYRTYEQIKANRARKKAMKSMKNR